MEVPCIFCIWVLSLILSCNIFSHYLTYFFVSLLVCFDDYAFNFINIYLFSFIVIVFYVLSNTYYTCSPLQDNKNALFWYWSRSCFTSCIYIYNPCWIFFVDQISCLILHVFPTLIVFNSEIILYCSLFVGSLLVIP